MGEGCGSAQPPVSAGDFKGDLSFGVMENEKGGAGGLCRFFFYFQWTGPQKTAIMKKTDSEVSP